MRASDARGKRRRQKMVCGCRMNEGHPLGAGFISASCALVPKRRSWPRADHSSPDEKDIRPDWCLEPDPSMRSPRLWSLSRSDPSHRVRGCRQPRVRGTLLSGLSRLSQGYTRSVATWCGTVKSDLGQHQAVDTLLAIAAFQLNRRSALVRKRGPSAQTYEPAPKLRQSRSDGCLLVLQPAGLRAMRKTACKDRCVNATASAYLEDTCRRRPREGGLVLKHVADRLHASLLEFPRVELTRREVLHRFQADTAMSFVWTGDALPLTNFPFFFST